VDSTGLHTNTINLHFEHSQLPLHSHTTGSSAPALSFAVYLKSSENFTVAHSSEEQVKVKFAPNVTKEGVKNT
jgi:hypothetical protein